MSTRRPARRGFTVVEILVILFVILVLAGLLFPALSGAFSVGRETKSIARLRQVGMWSGIYSSDNRERILPSRFDYTGPEYDGAYLGTVRSRVATEGVEHQGTWTDILWTENELATFPYLTSSGAAITDSAGVTAEQYLYDSPDANFYRNMAELVNWDPASDDVLRSAEPNGRDARGGSGPRPFGDGARERDLPGFFAANDFFAVGDPDPDPRTRFGFWSIPQIRQPDASLYAVDSAFGEVIPPDPDAFELVDGEPGPDAEVDLRYGSSAIMLLLDGSVISRSDWGTLDGLESGRGGPRVRVRNLADRIGADAEPGPGDPLGD